MAAGGKTLVIVESATKAKKIQKYLGDDFIVEASVGHIRDLPGRAADIPAKYKKEPWAKLGVNPEDGFTPIYVVDGDKKKKVSDLKAKLKQADKLLLATDPDREGEAIAWHLLETLNPKVPVERMVFNEITESAIREAAENTRELDMDLVDAQETRRILDRLYGYEVSPVLWKKVMPRLSAGRVQSVATRVIVERERERMAFISAEYWDLVAELEKGETFEAKLVALDGKRIAQGRDFDDRGRLKGEAVVVDKQKARALADALGTAPMQVTAVEEKPYSRKPYAPFMTSTLQQEAGRKLHFTSARTMRIAQRLYENGHITYMRTDSTSLSKQGLDAARSAARELYGANYVTDTPRIYDRKVKNSQEAHEAIRPAGERFATPGQLAGSLDAEEFKLYELIWARTVASQMQDARGTSMKVTVAGDAAGEQCEFAATGRTVTFPGWLRAYSDRQDNETRLPQLAKGDELDTNKVTADGHSTNPPARYTEASLVKKMEDLGIGRPSTYASIIKTIQDRGYVVARGNALVPSWVAFSVVGLLENNFDALVDYDFTASMEEGLDAIAAGEEDRVAWLQRFYFGREDEPDDGLKAIVDDLGEIDARALNTLKVTDTIDLRVGKYGPYLESGGGVDPETGEVTDPVRANVPDTLAPDELTAEKAEELMEIIGLDPALGSRYPSQLSGGQQQRVGVARALAADPPIMLMDEPFSALDPLIRRQLQDEFRQLTKSLGKSAVFITHDLDEAIRIGDRVNVQDGSVLHVDTDGETVLEDDVTIGHLAMVHGCYIEPGCLIGMSSTVLSRSRVGRGSIVGGGAVVLEGQELPAFSLAAGVPAKVKRTLEPETYEARLKHAAYYVELGRRARSGLVPVARADLM